MLPVSLREPSTKASKPAHTVVVIPARYDSTRLPGKPLADIGGSPMIAHVYRQAAATADVDEVIVATDDERVVRAVEDAGGRAWLTSAAHRTGTERVAEVAGHLDCEIVVNVQGDEPLVHPEMIHAAIQPLIQDRALQMSTVCREMTSDDDYLNPNVVKVVRDRRGMALYFSRSPIPHLRGPKPALWKHFGLYAYRREFLLTLAGLPPTPLEQAESLEQLRALENGYGIYAALTTHDSIGVDTQDDLDRARRLVEDGSGRPSEASPRPGNRAHI